MRASRRDALDIILFIGSIVALAFSIFAAGSMAIIAGINNILQGFENARAAWTISVIFSVMGLLTVPGLYMSYRSINGRSALISQSLSPLLLGVGVAFPLAIVLGVLSRQLNIMPFFIEPIAHVFAALTPMLFMSIYVIRRLPYIPWRRLWGYLSAGLWLSPFIALVLELLTAVPLIVLLFAYVWTEVDPRQLIEPLTTPSGFNETYLTTQIETALNQPLLIIAAVSYVTILVPLLEETVKTIALWPMLRRGLKPLYAFASGAVAGGAYGVFEAFFLAQPGEEWASLMVARAGATFMHMITTAVAGTGLAIGIRNRNWRISLRYYLLAVLLHGAWNLFALGMGLGFIFEETGTPWLGESTVTAIVIASGVVLAMLTAGAIWGLHTVPNKLLRTEQARNAQEVSAGVS